MQPCPEKKLLTARKKETEKSVGFQFFFLTTSRPICVYEAPDAAPTTFLAACILNAPALLRITITAWSTLLNFLHWLDDASRGGAGAVSREAHCRLRFIVSVSRRVKRRQFSASRVRMVSLREQGTQGVVVPECVRRALVSE